MLASHVPSVWYSFLLWSFLSFSLLLNQCLKYALLSLQTPISLSLRSTSLRYIHDSHRWSNPNSLLHCSRINVVKSQMTSHKGSLGPSVHHCQRSLWISILRTHPRTSTLSWAFFWCLWVVRQSSLSSLVK